MTVKEVALRLRIEEDNRKEIGSKPVIGEAKVNVVEHGSTSKAFKGKKKEFTLKLKGTTFKKKFEGKCYNCDKKGHKSSECRFLTSKKPEANMLSVVTNGVTDINLSAMVSEVNLVGSNPNEWWIDTGPLGMFVQSKSF